MRLFVILSVSVCLTLALGARLSAVKRRRESKWEIIHHEYHGPPAPLSKDGRVVDTAEVAEARANHLAIHAETVVELARKMAEAEAEEAKHAQEEDEKKTQEAAPEAEPEANPIVVAEPVQMTPELMTMLMAAAAEEQQPAPEVADQKAPKKEEVAPAPVVEEIEQETTPEVAAPASEKPAAEPASDQQAEEPTIKAPKEEEKPITEPESTNEVDAEHPITIFQKSYEGPLAPLGEDGRVLDTPEVQKAKEAHLHAYEQAAKLAKTKEDSKSKGEEEKPWYELRKKLYSVPIVHLIYPKDAPVGYKGPSAPLSKDGRVVDTEEVETAKAAHRKAYEHAEAIAKRHPPKAEDNLVR